MNTNIGMAGEFRCVVKRADGSTKIDTGYQKNLILDQGLDYFGSDDTTYSFNNACVVGTGNCIPKVTQTKLDNAVGYAIFAEVDDKKIMMSLEMVTYIKQVVSANTRLKA